MSFRLFSILLLIFGASSLFAQTSAPVIKDNTNPNRDETYKVDDVRGNIQRRAISLPKPSFPREALEAGADGAVKVEVVLGADGRVILAKAVSGHPMLYQTAEETARKTVFRKLEAGDPNATETGIIIYNFAIPKEGWVRIGYTMTAIQKMPTLKPLAIPRIAKAFQPDWTEEHEMLAKLNEMRRAEIEAKADPDPPTTRTTGLPQRPILVPNGVGAKAELRVQIPIPNPPTPERIALAQNLTASLQNRLAAKDELSLWQFNTGIALAKASELMRNPNESRNAAQVVREALDSAPGSVATEAREALGKLIELFENDSRTIESRAEIGKQMSIIFSSK